MYLKKMLFYLLFLVNFFSFANTSKFNVDFQYLNGKAGEYSYNKPGDGNNISYLEWEIKNIPLLRIGYEYRYNNWEFLIESRKNISNNIHSGLMQNYDWLPSDLDEETSSELFYIGDFTDLTSAENEKKENENIIDNQDGTYTLYYFPTKNDTGTLFSYSESKNYVKDIFGLNLSMKYFIFNKNDFKFAPILGIRYDKFSFFAKGFSGFKYIPGREYSYFSSNNSSKIITYDQEFFTPYIGIYSNYSLNDFLNIILEINGSYFGKAKAKDNHILRDNMLITEKYHNIKYLSFKLGLIYKISDSFNLKSEVNLLKYFKNQKSKVTITDNYGSYNKSNGSSGLSNKNIIYSLGFEYKL